MKATAFLALLSVSVLFSPCAFSISKADLKESCKGKYLVVMREGLAVGTCADHPGEEFRGRAMTPSLNVKIVGDEADYHAQNGATAIFSQCGEIVPQPLHKGEVLRVTGVGIHRGALMIDVETVSPHEVDRGMGGFGHQSFEMGTALLRFMLNGKDYDSVSDTVQKWVKPFDTEAEAAQLGNTAGGAFVKEIKVGMSFAQVEAALGPPQTRIDLKDKVLYKYKDMTVEFQSGKVTDVR